MDTTKALGFQVPPWLRALLQAWALLNTAPSRSLFTNKCGDFGDGIGWKLLKLMLKTDWTVLKMVEKSWKMAVKLLKIPRRMQKDVTSIMYIHAASINVQNNSWQKSAASVEVAIVCLKILSGCVFIFFHLPMANYDNYDNWLWLWPRSWQLSGCNSQTVRLSMNALCCSIRYTGYTYRLARRSTCSQRSAICESDLCDRPFSFRKLRKLIWWSHGSGWLWKSWRDVACCLAVLAYPASEGALIPALRLPSWSLSRTQSSRNEGEASGVVLGVNSSKDQLTWLLDATWLLPKNSKTGSGSWPGFTKAFMGVASQPEDAVELARISQTQRLFNPCKGVALHLQVTNGHSVEKAPNTGRDTYWMAKVPSGALLVGRGLSDRRCSSEIGIWWAPRSLQIQCQKSSSPYGQVCPRKS